MVSSAIWKKHARREFFKDESEGRVQFEVFEKLTSVCFFKLHEKPYYYLLIIHMCVHCRMYVWQVVTVSHVC